MSIAIPQQVAVGKTDPSTIYARITNKNIYRLNTECNPKQVAALIAQIKGAGKIHLKHWTLVETRSEYEARMEAWCDNDAVDGEPRAPQTSSLSPIEKQIRENNAGFGMRPLMGPDPIAPRFRYLDAFKLKCNDASYDTLVQLYEGKRIKADALHAALTAFQKTMGDTESDWLEFDRLQRLHYVVVAERDYAANAAAKEEFQV